MKHAVIAIDLDITFQCAGLNSMLVMRVGNKDITTEIAGNDEEHLPRDLNHNNHEETDTLEYKAIRQIKQPHVQTIIHRIISTEGQTTEIEPLVKGMPITERQTDGLW